MTGQEIAERRKKGETYESIGKSLGVSRQAVWSRLKREGRLTYVRHPRVNRPQWTTVFDIAKKQGKSIDWLAEKYGYSMHHLCSIRNGNRPISAEFVRRTMEIFDLPYDVLFTSEGS